MNEGGTGGAAGTNGGSGYDTMCAVTGQSCFSLPCCIDECIEEICGSPEEPWDSCIVGGQVYADGASNVPDPFSCNTCSCQAGRITVCTEMYCPNPPGPVGTRCRDDADCQWGLECLGEPAGERDVCTVSCDPRSGSTSCPTGSECASGLRDYNWESAGNYCMVPCATIADCGVLNSECADSSELSKKYCY